jgi:hypothetical protein
VPIDPKRVVGDISGGRVLEVLRARSCAIGVRGATQLVMIGRA